MLTSRPRKKRSEKKRQVAIILDLDWPYKRQIDVYHGNIEQCDRFGWVIP